MKKRWLFIPVAVAVVALAIVLPITLMPTHKVSAEQPWASFASQVASKLHVDEAGVFDAFEQAFQEGSHSPGDGLSSRMPDVTNEDVDRFTEWYQSRPEGCGPAPMNTIRCFGAHMGILYLGRDSFLDGLASRVAVILGMDSAEVVDAFHKVNRDFQDDMHREGLDRLVEEGCLTGEQAGQYYEWYQSLPEGFSPARMSCDG